MTATTSPPHAAQTPSSGSNILRTLRSLLGNQEVVLFLSLMALIVYVGSQNDRFLSSRNLAQILSGNAYLAVAAIGMTMVIVSGNIDISVGSAIVLLSIISGRISVYSGYPAWVTPDMIIALSWLLPLVFGALIGAVIGVIVTYMRVPSIVVTLGFLSILKGGLIIWTGGERVTDMPPGYYLAQWRPLETVSHAPGFLQQLNSPVYFMLVFTILAAMWMRYSVTGRAIYAVGGNAEAARLSGISEHRIVMTVFILNGVFVGMASVLLATQFQIIQTTVPPIELTIITAAVVGGVSILGGTGTAIGALLAAILLNTITKALVFLDISPFWTKAIQGILILVTVLVDLVRRQRENRVS